jgi:hypothetical protein
VTSNSTTFISHFAKIKHLKFTDSMVCLLFSSQKERRQNMISDQRMNIFLPGSKKCKKSSFHVKTCKCIVATIFGHTRHVGNPSTRTRPHYTVKSNNHQLQNRTLYLDSLHCSTQPLLQFRQLTSKICIVSNQLLVNLRQLVQIVLQETNLLFLC